MMENMGRLQGQHERRWMSVIREYQIKSVGNWKNEACWMSIAAFILKFNKTMKGSTSRL